MRARYIARLLLPQHFAQSKVPEEEKETMISGSDLYRVVSAMAPLYMAMGLGYPSVWWWCVLSAEHCAGIGRFVAVLAVPLIVFRIVAGNNPYAMNLPSPPRRLPRKAPRPRCPHSLGPSLPPILPILVVPIVPATARVGGHGVLPRYPTQHRHYRSPLAKWDVRSQRGGVGSTNHLPSVDRVVQSHVYEFIAAGVASCTASAARSENPNASIRGGGGDAADSDITILVPDGGDIVLTEITKDEENAGVGDGGGNNAAAAAAAEEERMRETKVVPVRKVMAVAVRKLVKVPSTYASFLGLLWSLIAFRFFIFLVLSRLRIL